MSLRRFVVPVAGALVAVSAWLAWDGSTRHGDAEAGTEAVIAVRESIVAMGTYQPDTVEQNLTAARDRLTGSFRDDYNQAIQTVVIPDARGRRMSSVMTVPAVGVVRAESDRAVLLAYVDQTLTVAGERPVVNPARYRVTVEKVDGRWLIAGFDQI